MAKRQTDQPSETIEQLLEKANRKALEEKEMARFEPQSLTDDELRSLAIEKLSIALQAIDPVLQPEMTRKLAAEVKDRLDGKPAQAIHQTNETTIHIIAEEQRQLAVDEVQKAIALLKMPVIENH